MDFWLAFINLTIEVPVVEEANWKDLFPVSRCGGNIPVETMPELDNSLIAEFNARRSEAAFAALVRQHVNLVFATAMRQVGDAGAAEEITQNVFVALAQSAGKLSSHPTIAGWLHQTALNKSREWLRAELRRRKREQVAINLELTRAEGDSVWAPLVPLLDEALLKLSEPDRQAVILHFMEGRNFQEVGSTLGVGEDAARKRVNRCLGQLTDFFRRRGFAVPTLAVGAPLFTLSSQAAPAGLAASAMTAGLAAAHSAAATSTLTLIQGALKIMAWSKMKTTVVVSIALMLAAGTTGLVIKHQRQAHNPIRVATAGSSESAKQSLQGHWTGSNTAHPGETCTLNISGDRIEYRGAEPNDWLRGTFVLNENTQPGQMNVTIIEPASNFIVGIYEVKGGKMIIAVAPHGSSQRPIDYTPGPQVDVLELQHD
jgi:RNA polymerase sigma factor (sigma-70 family)